MREFGRVLISAALSSLINDENERREGSSEPEKIQMYPCDNLVTVTLLVIPLSPGPGRGCHCWEVHQH